mmetsp:Transcript_48817/g.136656  ORF Transcript_48817/g.136656 Transcript_48817/m.136656 type:complete len:206 (+) Transcript_48817:527-1144(+)
MRWRFSWNSRVWPRRRSSRPRRRGAAGWRCGLPGGWGGSRLATPPTPTSMGSSRWARMSRSWHARLLHVLPIRVRRGMSRERGIVAARDFALALGVIGLSTSSALVVRIPFGSALRPFLLVALPPAALFLALPRLLLGSGACLPFLLLPLMLLRGLTLLNLLRDTLPHLVFPLFLVTPPLCNFLGLALPLLHLFLPQLLETLLLA